MYAIVKTGGKQYRVSPDQWLLVERLPVPEGEEFELPALLFVDGEELIDGDALSGVTVRARVLAHERGPKLRIVKFKPKRGYKRRTGHRQELTRIEIAGIDRSGGASSTRSRSRKAPAATAATASAPAAAADAATTKEGSDGA